MFHLNTKEKTTYINVPYAPPRGYVESYETTLSFDNQDDWDNFVVESHDNEDGSKYVMLGIHLYNEPIYLCPAVTQCLRVQTSDNKPDDGLILIGTQYIEFESINFNND